MIAPANIDEGREPGEKPNRYVLRIAHAKAAAVATSYSGRWVLGADTIVVLEGDVLGKPRDEAHALELLRALAGKTHSVLTGVALVAPTGADERLFVESRVTFRAAEDQELRDYLTLGESLDKAGAYALQGAGRRFVTRVEGDESNVIGLPLEATLAMLRRSGCPTGGER